MLTFKCSAIVISIYRESEELIELEYRAKDKQTAIDGFTNYLQTNRNLTDYRKITVI